ncbi:MAG: SPOR domain-containing protein [Actinomycetota bacterium]
MAEFWFNTKTRQVEEGHISDWTNLMGPYPTREAAERALETARERTERWDEEDRRWEEWGEN